MASKQTNPESFPGIYITHTSEYAQVLATGSQSNNFSISMAGPLISNRDMGELMSRDHDFAKGPQLKGSPNQTPSEENESIKHFIVAADGFGVTGSIYSSLYEEGQFRLLAILPGTDDTTIRCRLHVCSLDDNHDTYEALSYCWRADSSYWSAEDPTIECNGVEMVIGVNLHLALRRIRHPDSTRVVWADAICIDQSNPVERSQQVAAMGDIFRNAFRVLVWLGPDEDSTVLSSVCSIVSTWATPTNGPVNVEAAHYRIQGQAQDFHGMKGPLPEDSPVWFKALNLYKKLWFQRLWVVQEIALAQRATVIWGKCEMCWEWIGLAAAIIRTNWHRIVPRHSKDDFSGRQVPVGIMNAYFMYRISHSQGYLDPLRFSFCELLTLTRQFGCQEKRDKIFGLLGLTTTDGVNSLITPDYTSPLEEVYRSVACALIGSKNPLALLSHVHHTEIFDHPGREIYQYDHTSSSETKSAQVTPLKDSWIPRWHVKGPQTLTPLDAHPDFAAGLSKPVQIRDGFQGNQLTIQGIILDKVGHTVWMDSLSFRRHDGYGSIVFTQGIQQSQGIEQILAQTNHTRHSLEKLALTLTAGKIWYGTPIKDRSGMLAGFANCLVGGWLGWALESKAFGPTDEKRTGSGKHFGDQAADAGNLITMSELEMLAAEGNGELFLDAVTTACVGRRLFSTGSGLSGVGPLDTRPGDMVCIIYGTAVPFVIRPCEGKQGYALVGECYVQDLMHGDVVGDGRYSETWIELV